MSALVSVSTWPARLLWLGGMLESPSGMLESSTGMLEGPTAMLENPADCHPTEMISAGPTRGERRERGALSGLDNLTKL